MNEKLEKLIDSYRIMVSVTNEGISKSNNEYNDAYLQGLLEGYEFALSDLEELLSESKNSTI